MQQIVQRLKYLLSGILFLLTSAMTSALPVLAQSAHADPAGKVFVCKYVGTPYVNERLQTGQNPIDVSINSIADYQGVGSYFNDAQGQSYVLAADTGQASPDVSSCPGARGVTPASVTFADACGTAQDTYTIPSTTGVNYQVGGVPTAAGTYSGSGTVTVTAVAQTNYTVSGTTSWSHTFDTTPCYIPPTPVTPSPVTFSDTCGTSSDTYTIPTTTGVDYRVNGVTVAAGTYPGSGTVTVTAVAQNGYVLSGTTSWSHRFNTTPCVVPVTPAPVTFNDACGWLQDTYTIPSTPGVAYHVGGVTKAPGTYTGSGTVTVTAVAQNGYTLTGTQAWTHTFTNVPCDSSSVTLCHATDSRQNPYVKVTVSAAGAYNGHLTQHTGPIYSPLLPRHAKWGDIIPTFNYNGSTYSENWNIFGMLVYGNDCHVWTPPHTQPVTAAAVTFKDATCETGGTYTVPNTPHVTYKDARGNVVPAGTYTASFGQTVTITAYANSGYTLTGYTHSWTHTFMMPEGCGGGGEITPTPPTITVTPSACLDTVLATGSVTLTITNPNDLTVIYTVVLNGVTKTVSLNGHTSGDVSFDNLPAGSYRADVTGNDDTQTSVDTSVATCIPATTGGKGGGPIETAAAPVVTTQPATQSELSNTGISVVIPSLIALTMIVTAAGITFSSRQRSTV